MDALLLLIAASGVHAALSSPSDAPIIIKDLAAPRYFGAAANTSWLFVDQNYTDIVKTQFSIFTPENEMKWEMIEPFQGVFNFTPADEIVKFAESVEAKVHGHTFVWASQLAPWVNDTLSATELDNALENHITKVMEHFKGRIYAWDIVNELISDTAGLKLKDNLWTKKLGELVIPKALTYARNADPKVKLYVNEYGIEGINNKSNTLYDLVKSWQKDNVPLDGIGFQSHFRLGQVPPTFQENLQRFADLGLDVAITELDINIGVHGNATTLAQQAKDYHAAVEACVKVSRCVSVTVWGVSDERSWLPYGDVLPWDAQKNPKPAFYAIADAFKGQ